MTQTPTVRVDPAPVRVKRGRWAVVAVVIALVVGIAALWPVYIDPQVERPATADAIVVLGGRHDGREELGLQLAKAGYAPQVILSNPYKDSPLVNRICHGGYSFKVTCFDPDPGTTRGEGREIARRAAAENWKRVIVVTFTPHVSRARYVIGKCWDGELLMVPNRQKITMGDWVWNYVYQSFGYARALFEDC
ncbi:YdcF family protein [Antrihabitans cavernicola]|uniref:YdcF family protein n=1 Tax=Antrihabitans cavernicola TaxID=2495913 RepID=A0A5A7S420_9NOCA|nr:YdcF family protein [Spelaeibacter cavernicola]KAA0018924.1 YdcF family protein [Spelaeibacter cavernicola]